MAACAGNVRYHLLLLGLGILVLGPLGGIAATYMNFSLGFYVGGQVLAGILGSTVTLGYGAEGKHGANYIQTSAASVAGMSAMGVLIQAMVWMGMAQPPAWQLVLYMLCIGMFGAGVGMLYTPILVDRMQLTYPSGLAVANILRALTDPVLLRKSVNTLGSGIGLGIAGGIASAKWALISAIDLSTSTFGAGMIVGARIGVPTIVAGALGWMLIPYFVSIGWLNAGDPFRKITFLIALGTIMGAAIVDISIIFRQALRRILDPQAPAAQELPQQDWQRTNTARLVAWVLCWGAGILLTGHMVLGQPLGYLAFALALVFIFALVNGISVGISDQQSDFVGFRGQRGADGGAGAQGPDRRPDGRNDIADLDQRACDMQQDRSTGWRLGTNRVIQFRYQVAGILMGAILAVGLARVFMAAYPVLLLDQTVMKAGQQPAEWSAAMTYKFVGVLRSLTDDKPYQRTAIWVGVAIGFAIQLLRALLKSNAAYRRFVASGRSGYAIDFVLDALFLPSPYAFSFGGFVNLNTSLWFGAGGIFSSAFDTLAGASLEARTADCRLDMSATSLFGGGLIAGDALAALGIGIAGLLATVAR